MEDIRETRSRLVVKSNALIQKARYELGLQEQKIILYIISQIKPSDDSLREFDVELKELCKACGVQLQGKNYANFKKTIKSLRDRSFWISDGDTEVLFSWVSEVEIKGSMVKIELGKYLATYLLHLKQNFTAYELDCVLAMTSKYSIRFFEIFKSYANLGTFTVSVDELKKMINADGYDIYANFRSRILEPVISEINELTELDISYEPIRKGKKIEKLCFKMSQKAPKEHFETMFRRAALLERNDQSYST